MIASLGMYDRPETAKSLDTFWAAIRSNLGYGPHNLDRTSAFMDIWQSPDLLMSQTCGMPYRLGLHRVVQLVGTPDYNIPDTQPGYYHSVFVVRKNDDTDVSGFADRILAYNNPTSQSGWAAPQNHASGLGFQFRNLFRSGKHMASAQAVANGQADIAALDAVTWRMICNYDALACELKVIQTTAPTPGLPFITAADRNADEIFCAADEAIHGLNSDHRKILGLNGIVRIDAASYLNVPTPAAPDS